MIPIDFVVFDVFKHYLYMNQPCVKHKKRHSFKMDVAFRALTKFATI